MSHRIVKHVLVITTNKGHLTGLQEQICAPTGAQLDQKQRNACVTDLIWSRLTWLIIWSYHSL